MEDQMQSIVREVLIASVKRVNTNNRTITFVGTKESPDRTGDIIRVAGWEFDNFQKNPVFLWNHDTDILPPGKVTKILVVGKEVHFDVKFATASIQQFAEAVFRSFEEGFLSAVSVGFIPKDIEPIFSDDGMLVGLDILRSELLELSAVAIPAHADALAASIYAKAFADIEGSRVKPNLEKTKPTMTPMTLEEYRKSLPPFTEEVDEPMTDTEQESFQILTDKVAELEATVKSLITLRESVDLSVKTMETLNKTIVGKLSNETPNVVSAVKTVAPVVSKTQPTLNLEKLMGALGSVMEKIEKSNDSQFKVEGDK
jgi:phage head maturation protease